MIRRISVGPLGENVYIIENAGGPLVVFDPGDEAERLLHEVSDSLARTGSRTVLIAMTHGHLDHIAALPGLVAGLAAQGVPVMTMAPVGDRAYFGAEAMETHRRIFASIHGLSYFAKHWIPIPEADIYFDDGYVLPGTDIVALHTPGHTIGSSCFLSECGSTLVSGDTLFRDGRGRTDNDDADDASIYHSIREKLCTLPDPVRVWPGHGPETTIGREKRQYVHSS